MKLSKEELELILALRTDRNFNLFMSLVAREVEALNKRLVCTNMPTDDLVRLQGEVRFGVSLMEVITEAEAQYERHLQPRS